MFLAASNLAFLSDPDRVEVSVMILGKFIVVCLSDCWIPYGFSSLVNFLGLDFLHGLFLLGTLVCFVGLRALRGEIGAFFCEATFFFGNYFLIVFS